MIVSNTKPLTGDHLPGDKYTGIDPAILLYEVEDDDNYDSGNEAVIHVKIDKSLTATKQNTKKLTFTAIKYFYRQGTKFVRVLRENTVSIFEHLGITSWIGIDQRWMLFEKVMNGTALNKFWNTVIAYKQLVRDEDGEQWGLDE